MHDFHIQCKKNPTYYLSIDLFGREVREFNSKNECWVYALSGYKI